MSVCIFKLKWEPASLYLFCFVFNLLYRVAFPTTTHSFLILLSGCREFTALRGSESNQFLIDGH